MRAHPPDDLLLADPVSPDVSRHLESCPRCRVHRRLLADSTPTGPGVAPDAADVGERLDDDGVSKRWMVWNDGLGRLVVHVEPAGPTDIASFEAASAVVQSLHHPHLGQVHGVVSREPFRYARERIPGGHLGEAEIAHDPRAVAWLAQTSSVLSALHDAGVAHGALVPQSIRITPEGRVRLVGVGVAGPGAPRDDWRALGDLFGELRGPIGAVARSLAESREPSGAPLMAALLSHRDPGAGGGPRYESRGLLGVGGMGEVRRVYDPVLDRVVAQKVLSGALLANQEQIERFLEEAHITAQLQHPGVVPVHDLEHLPDGAIAFTMKQLEGQTLAQVIREVHEASADTWRTTPDGWSLRRLVEALRRVCDAVAYAHSRSIVHLDLKPGNVMLGEYGEVLVFDWGLAQELQEDGLVRLARSSGTPGYMPPEQAAGAPIEVGPAADIYALGVCLREVLDGQAPEAGQVGWSPVRSDAPPELVSIARRATQHAPGARYRSARDLAADLAAWQDERPVDAHRYSSVDRLVRRLRPHIAPIAVSVVSAVVLLALGFVAWMRVEGERDKADGMLAQALVDKANLAWDARDPIRAEAFAAAAIGLTGRPDARGLMARLSNGWRPRLLHRRAESCGQVLALGTPAHILCATDEEVRAWDPGQPGLAWSVPGAYAGLGEATEGRWLASTGAAVVQAEVASGTHAILSTAEAPVVQAVDLGGGRVARATAGRIDIVSAEGVGPSLVPDAPVRALSGCGSGRLAVATEGGGITLMDVGDGTAEPVRADRVRGPMRCSKSARKLALVSDRSIQIWSLSPPVQRHILTGHLGTVVAVAWSPDGRILASASRDGTVRLWDARRGLEQGRLPGHDGVRDLAFTPDGASLVTATDRLVRVWELPSEDHVASFDAVVEVVRLSWADDGSLFTLDRLGRPVGFDPRSGLQTMPIFLRVVDFAPSAEGGLLAVVVDSGDFRVLDLEENVYVFEAEGAHAGGATAVAWRPGSDLVASGGQAGDVRAWSVGEPGSEAAWSVGLGAPVTGLGWSAGGEMLAARTERGVVVIDGDRGERLVELPGEVEAHALGPAGDLVALAWRRGGLSLGTGVASGTPRFSKLEVQGVVSGVAFAPDGPLLAAVTREGLVQVFDTRDGSERGRLFAHPAGATDLAFSRDGSTLATAGTQGEVVLLDTRAFLETSDTLVAEVARRYGVVRTGTELEFR